MSSTPMAPSDQNCVGDERDARPQRGESRKPHQHGGSNGDRRCQNPPRSFDEAAGMGDEQRLKPAVIGDRASSP